MKIAFRISSYLILGIGAVAVMSPVALAQNAAGPVAREVVQPLPSPEIQQLNTALLKLAANPRDVDAMVAAGNAALHLNDLEAAMGFFSRAEEQSPGNSQAKMGLAAVLLRTEHPIEALQYFEEAEREGATLGEVHAERGLAYDLVGRNKEAQQSYRAALAIKPDDDVTRRLALSHAIAGDRASFEAVLRPLLDRRDFAAYRTRAFGLAILGQIDDANAIAEAVMPRDMASHMTPYLAYMPRLTRAQQAAAANLGIFPKAAQIGRDDPRIAQFAAAGTSAASSADTRLAPQGEPLDKGSGKKATNRASSDDRRRRPDRTGSRSDDAPSASGSRLASVAQSQVYGPTVTQESPKESRETLAEAFSGLANSAKPATTPASGAVDIGSIKVPREAPPKTKPEPPKNPSRIWVQVATGRDRSALRFDWRRFEKKAPDLLGRYEPHVVRWGQANRLLTGPLPSEREARELIKALKAKGVDSFTYTSPDGEEIIELQ